MEINDIGLKQEKALKHIKIILYNIDICED